MHHPARAARDAGAVVPYGATVERFLQRMSNEGRSPRTLAAYRYDLDDTMTDVAAIIGLVRRNRLDALPPPEREAAMIEAFDQLDLADVTPDHLDEAIAEFRTRPDPRFVRHPERSPDERSPATVARRVAAVRSFFAWCYRTKRIPADPAAMLTPPKKRKRIPKAMDQGTAERTLAQAGEGSAWPERDILVIVLALACGLRLDEMARLRLDDVTGGDTPVAITVRGKGDKERRLGLAPVVTEAMQAYFPTRRAHLDRVGLDAQTVIVSTRPRPVRDRRGEVVGMTVESTRETVVYVVDRVLRRVGARRDGVRVHALRHTFATLGLREGAFSLRQLQVALGHASLATTQIYTEVADEEIAAAMRLHPLGAGGMRAGPTGR